MNEFKTRTPTHRLFDVGKQFFFLSRNDPKRKKRLHTQKAFGQIAERIR